MKAIIFSIFLVIGTWPYLPHKSGLPWAHYSLKAERKSRKERRHKR